MSRSEEIRQAADGLFDRVWEAMEDNTSEADILFAQYMFLLTELAAQEYREKFSHLIYMRG